jgi:autotransporter-associated beta strand protein
MPWNWLRRPSPRRVKLNVRPAAEPLEPRFLPTTIGYLYTNNNDFPNSVSAFAVQDTGSLVKVPGSPFLTGGNAGGFFYDVDSIALDAANRRVYVTNLASNTISGFNVQSDGSLVAVPGGPVATGSKPVGVTVDPLGRFVYVANRDSGTLSVYSIGASGQLSPVGSPVPTVAGTNTVEAAPSGNFVYATGSANETFGFAVSATGTLTPVPGSPYAGVGNGQGSDITADGQFLYVANNQAQAMVGYRIDPTTGALSAVPGSPFAPAFAGAAVDANGSFLFTDANGSQVGVFARAGDGSLTPVAGSPFPNSPGSNTPTNFVVTPDVKHLFAVNTFSTDVGVFDIAASGKLTQHSGSPYDLGDSGAESSGIALLVNRPSTVTVDPSFTGPAGSHPAGNPNLTIGVDAFSSIQAGVNAVAASGTVLIDAGTYNESVTATRAVTLSAQGAVTVTGNLTLGAAAVFNLNNFGASVGDLAGSGPANLGSATLTAGDDGASTTYAGSIGGSGGLTKTGTGTFTLTGTSGYTGATTVSAGGLLVNGSIASNVTVSSGSTLGGSGTTGTATVSGGGSLTPGTSPGILNTGSLSLAGGSSYNIEVGGNTPGSYDQDNVTGGVGLGGATLNLSALGGYVPQAGDQYVLVSNDGSDAVNGTFAGLAEGAVVSSNFLGSGLTASITYQGGDGNDVVLVVTAPSGPLTYTSPGGSLTLNLDSAGPNPNLELLAGSTVVASRPFAGVTAVTINGSNTANDSLTVDFVNGSPIPAGGVTYHGNGQASVPPGDVLVITGGSGFSSLAYNATGAGAANLVFDGTRTVSFDGLESAVSITPAAASVAINVDPGGSLGGLVSTTFTGGGGTNTASFDNGLVGLIFADPTAQLLVNGHAGSDSITVAALDSGFGAELDISGGSGTDTVNLNAPLTLNGSLAIDGTVETTALNAGVTATSVSLRGPAATVGANVTVDTSAANGAITFGGTIDDAAADAHTLTLMAGAGSVTVGGAVGGTPLLGFAVASAGSAALQGVTAGSGGISVTTSTGATLNGALSSGGAVALTGNETLGGSVTVAYSGPNGLSVTGGTVGLGARTLTLTDGGAGSSGSVTSTLTGAGGSLSKQGAGTLTLDGGAANPFSGATTASAGTLVLAKGANTNALGGALNIAAGATVRLGAPEQLPDAAGVTDDGTFDLAGHSETVDGLVGDGTVTSAAARAVTLTVGAGGGNGTFAGAIQDGSGTLALTKAGGGTEVLSAMGTFTYTGATMVSAGTLVIDGALAAGSAVSVSGGTLSGGGTAAGSVGVGSGGHLAPGDGPGTLHTGSLALAAGARFDAAIGGNSPGGYAQDDVTGGVSLGGATLDLSAFGGFVPRAGDEYVLVRNDGNHAVSGTLVAGSGIDAVGPSAALPEGAVLSTDFLGSGLAARLTYRGGDGNDVAVVVDGPLPYTSLGGALTLKLDTAGPGPNLELLAGSTVSDSRPFAGVSAVTIDGSATQDDSLAVDCGNGDPVPAGGVTFHGNGQASVPPGDVLNVTGGSGFTSLAYRATGAGAGSLVLDGTRTIAFDGLESAAVSPAAATTTVSIADGAAHTATFTGGPGAGLNTVSLDGGLTPLTFADPTAQLVVNADPGGDTVTLASLDAGFDAALAVHGSTGAGDVVNVDTPLTLGGALAVDAAVETTGLNADVAATSVSLQGRITTVGANVTLDTAAASGAITIGGAVTDAAADAHTLTLRAGTGGVALGGAVGDTPLLGFAVTSAGTAALQGVTAGGGGISITTSVGATLGGDLSSGGAVTLTGNATLGRSVSIGYSGASALSVGGGTIGLGASTLTVADGGASSSGSVSSALTGAGGALAKRGAGTLTLGGTAASTYSGATAVGAGTLVLAKGPNTDALGGALDIAAGATVQLAADEQVADTAAVTDGGTLDLAGHGETVDGLAGGGTVISTVTGAVTLTVGAGGGSGTFAGTIQDGSGTVALTKVGGGTLTLSNAGNRYSGGTTVSAGTLRLGATNALPGQDVRVDGTLDLNGFSEAVGGLNGSGTVTSGAAGAVTLAVGSNNADGNFAGVLQDGSGTVALTKQGGGTQRLTGTRGNAFTGTTTVRAGMLALGKTAGVNAVGSSSITIAAGSTPATLRLDASDQVPDTATVSLNATGTSASTFDLHGESETIDGLAGAASPVARVTNSVAAITAILTVGAGGATATFGGVLEDGSGRLAPTKAGGGTEVLSAAGTFTYTGATTVSAGTLVIDGALAAGSAVTVSGGTLTGGGTAPGTVSVGSGGRVAPGDGTGTLHTGSLALAAGARFAAAVGGNGPGGYAEDDVTGGVSLGGAALDLSAFSGYLPRAGDEYVLVRNDGSDAVGGTLVAGSGIDAVAAGATLPEGSLLSTNFLGGGLAARVTYKGGDGNDVAVVVDGPLVYTSPGGGLTLKLDSAGPGPNLELLAGSTVSDSRPFVGINEVTISGSDTQNDSLTVDCGNGDPVPAGGVTFHGNGQASVPPGDVLAVTGGPGFASLAYSATGAGAGALVLEGTRTVRFDGLEAATVSPPVGSTTVAVGDGLSHTATFTSGPGAGLNTVGLDGGLTPLTFADPTAQLTLDADPGSDTFTFASLDPGFGAALAVHGSTGAADTVNVNTPLTLGGVLSVDAAVETTALNADVTAASVSLQGPTTAVGANVTLDTAAASGAITIGGTLTDAVAGAHALTLNAGTGGVTLSGVVGVAPLLGLTIANAGTATLPGVTTGAGGIRITTSVGAALNGDLSSGGAVTLTGNATLGGSVTVAYSGAAALRITGGAVNLGASTLTVADAGASSSGLVSSALTGAGGTLTKRGAGTLTLGGTAVNTYSGATTVGAGTLVLAKGANTNAVGGALDIAAGATVRLGAAEQVPDAAAVMDDGTLDLAGRSETVDGLGGGGAVTSTAAGAVTLAVGAGGGSGSFDGTIQDGSSTLALTKAGGGTEVLSAAGTFIYTGATAVSAGTLEIDGALAAGSAVSVSGGTLSGGGTAGMVSIGSGGRLAPGDGPGTLHTDGLALTAGAHFDAAISGNSPGSYGQDDVTRGVSLGGATLDLSASSGYAPRAGDEYILVRNDGSDAVGGTFIAGSGIDAVGPGAALPEGVVLSADFLGSGLVARLTYRGGDGNDVAAVVDGPLSHASPGGSLTLTLDTAGPNPNLELLAGSSVIDSRPFAGVSGVTIDGSATQNDSLAVDCGNGDPIPPGGVSFHGNGQASVPPGDTLVVMGGPGFASLAYRATGAGAGSLVLDGTRTIAFDGLESAAVSPAAATTSVSIADGAAHTATFTAGPATGLNSVSFDGGLTPLTFADPTTQLTVNADPGSDAFTFAALDPGFSAAVTVHGSTGGADAVNLNAPLGLSGALTVDAAVERTALNARVSARSVSVQSPTTAIGADVTVDTSASGGDITLAGAVNDTTANAHVLTLQAGPGSVILAGGVGATPLLGFAVAGAGASLQAVSTGTTGISVTTSGATLGGSLTSAGPLSLAGNVTLGNAVTLTHAGAGSLSISGGMVNTGGFVLTDTPTTGASTGSIASAISGAGSLVKTGPGTLTLTSAANSYTGPTTVQGGTLLVNGSLAPASALTVNGGTLGGGGTVGGTVTVNSGGTVSPDLTLGTGKATFASGSTYTEKINSPTDLDELLVGGSATLGGATLNVSGRSGFVPAVGTPLTILHTSAGVSGQFVQGTSITLGNIPCSITYGANGGDDVTLQAVAPGTVYVDDTWAGDGSTVGAAPNHDPLGSSLVFGYNAFADVPSALGQVAAGGTVVLFGGTYGAAVDVNKPLTGFQAAVNPTVPTETAVAVNGAVTLDVGTTLSPGGTFAAADLVFGSTINGPQGLTINEGPAHVTFQGALGGLKPVAGLAVSAGSIALNGSTTTTSAGISLQAGSQGLLNGTLDAGGGPVSLAGGGNFILGAAERLADASPVTVGTGTTLDLNGFVETVGSLAGPASAAVNLRSGTLTTGGSGDSTVFAGAISGSGGTLTKAGGGTFTLGAGTYTGPTNLAGGALTVTGSLYSAAAPGVVNLTGTGVILSGGGTVHGQVRVDAAGATVQTLTVRDTPAGAAGISVQPNRGGVIVQGTTVLNGAATVGILVQSGAAATLGGNTVTGAGGAADTSVGIAVRGSGAPGLTRATVLNNVVTGNNQGLDVSAATAFVQGNTLDSNTAGTAAGGLVAENGAVVDAGQLAGAAAGYGDFTGLGGGTPSLGRNSFAGYTAATGAASPSVPQAIRDLNANGNSALAGAQGAPWDLTAQGNTFGAAATPAAIDAVLYHDADAAGLGFVLVSVPAALPHVVPGSLLYYAATPADGGAFTATGLQRSAIRYIQVSFDEAVYLDPAHNYGLDLVEVNGPGYQPGNTNPAGGRLIAATVVRHAYNPQTGQDTVVYAFAGAGTEYGSLEDGNYSLQFFGPSVQGGGPGGPGLATAVNQSFFRFFGDSNGDRVVKDSDTTAFLAAYRSRSGMANYRGYFDFNADGLVDSTDYYQFLRRRSADGNNNPRGYQLNADGTISAVP